MIVQEADVVFASGAGDRRVSVVIPSYNYQNYIIETLETIVSQSYRDIAIVVVDDRSSDDSVNVIHRWMEGLDTDLSLFLLSNRENGGLGLTRNTGVNYSQSEFCFFLDSDNHLYKHCIRKHVDALDAGPEHAAAYSLIEVFDAETGIMGSNVFSRDRLKYGNYIDAMSMVRRDVLVDMAGYRPANGWEDYDLWLRLCAREQKAIQIPEILSRYRVHAKSMLRTQTNVVDKLRVVYDTMYEWHPWLELNPLPEAI
jgi:glycosyltransferase involved in cell wall biosynthesis